LANKVDLKILTARGTIRTAIARGWLHRVAYSRGRWVGTLSRNRYDRSSGANPFCIDFVGQRL